MRTRTVLIFLFATIAIAATGCGGRGDAKGDGDEVVAAFYPLAFLAEQVAPDAAVRNLTPPGAEPHDLELSPRDVAGLRDARRVLYLGGGFMPSLEDAVAGRSNAVDLLAGVPRIDDDPHVWLDPDRYASLARRVAAMLGTPAAADALVARLERLDEEFRDGLAHCERREIVTSHAAFGYLAPPAVRQPVAELAVEPPEPADERIGDPGPARRAGRRRCEGRLRGGRRRSTARRSRPRATA